MPDAAIVLDRDGRVIAVQRGGARDRAGARARCSRRRLRCACPEIVDAVREARRAQRAAQRRVLAARAGRPLVRGACRRSARTARRSALMLLAFHDLTPLRRSRRCARLRRQCEPRAAHAACRALRLHRHAAGAGARRRGGARPVPRHHEDAGRAHGAPDRRPALALAHRAESSICIRTRRSIWWPVVRQVVDGLQTLARDRNVDDRGRAAGRAADRARRPRRTHPRVREPGRERAEIRRVGQARRRRLRDRERARPAPRRWSRCATTVPASRPSICRG